MSCLVVVVLVMDDEDVKDMLMQLMVFRIFRVLDRFVRKFQIPKTPDNHKNQPLTIHTLLKCRCDKPDYMFLATIFRIIHVNNTIIAFHLVRFVQPNHQKNTTRSADISIHRQHCCYTYHT
mmetsp:Transcript_36131/g.87336  ORF Transcript_36131/g.87336 Transcript_36131/m.87336 type:complete len:121 (+) Transcript_36131:2460-2822(+)